MTNQSNIHPFYLSGLGLAPFQHCSENDGLAKFNFAFFCEHCGTMLKNRYFVKSYDGKVSVVGIDCLRKTGDQSLIDETNSAIKEAKKYVRHSERESRLEIILDKERLAFNGKSRDEASCDLLRQYEQYKDESLEQIEDLDISVYLERSDFGLSMLNAASNRGEITTRMIVVMIEITAKELSGARKNSKLYKASLEKSTKMVTEFTTAANEINEKLGQLYSQRIDILNKKII
jgi:hypothetical protein